MVNYGQAGQAYKQTKQTNENVNKHTNKQTDTNTQTQTSIFMTSAPLLWRKQMVRSSIAAFTQQITHDSSHRKSETYFNINDIYIIYIYMICVYVYNI